LPRSADEVCSLLASLGSASSCVFFSQVIISHARPGRRGSSRNKTSPRLLKRSDATFGFDGGDAPARNERSCIECIIFPARVRCAACLPYSTVTHAPPAVAGCPSCLAQTYESLAHAQRPPVAADHGALVECGSCCICKFLWRDESDCMCVVVQGPQASG
jgi:hypothetical protein